MKVFLFVILTLLLSACGGGGGSSSGGGGTTSTTPSSGGGGGTTSTNPVSGAGDPSTNPVSGGGGGGNPSIPDSMAGRFALKGISRIPVNVARLSNAEMRKRYLIMDSGISSFHALRIRIAACLSYVVACDQSDSNSLPFTQANFLNELPTALTSKNNLLAVVSVQPGGREFYLAADAKAEHVGVQGAGNDDPTNFFDAYEYQEASNSFIIVETQEAAPASTNSHLLRIIAATRDPNADKVLYVAGSTTDRSGNVIPHSSTTQCGTKYIEAHCLYAPFISQYPHPNGMGGFATLSGTSISAQLVGAALASVWSVFPNTPPSQLLRLAKNCAKPEPGLNGLGLADFTCMTVPSGTGFRIVTQAELSSCVASKGRCLTSQGVNSLAFPGSTSIATNIGGLSFSRNKEGTFKTGNFTVGIPHQMGTSLLAKPWDVHLFGTGDAEEGSLGIVWENNKQMFVAAAFGVREEFFGLGSEQGYTDIHSLDGKLGHENFFARVSYQEAKGDSPLLEEARGTAIGFTLQDEFKLGLDSTLQLVLATDRFTGGVANTVFGRLKMDESDWNETIQLAFDTSIAKNTVLSLNALNRWFGGQEDTTGTISLKKLF